MLVLTQCTEDGVGCRAHSTLQWQEFLWNTTFVHLLHKELSCEVSYLVCNGVAVGESTSLIRNVAFNHTHQFLFGYRHIRNTNSVAYMLNWNCLAVRRVKWLINIMNKLGIGIVESVQLKNNLFGQTGCSRRNTTSSCQVGTILCWCLLNIAHFKDCPVNFTIESIAQFLCHVAQMKVIVRNFSLINMLAEIGIRGIRSAILQSLCISQISIGTLSGRCSSKYSHLELTSCFMLFHGNLCKFFCYSLSHTSRCKSAKSKILIVFNKRCSFSSGQTCVSHY